MSDNGSPQSRPGLTESESEIRDELFQLAKYDILDFAIILMDVSGGITSWNAGAESIFQHREAEVLGKSADLIFTSEDRQKHQPHKERTEATDQGRADDERWHVRRDGSRFMASGVLTALRNQQGQLRGYAKVLRDVTERIRTDELLQQARHYDLLAVLAGGVAHDFNNLLTSILGNTSLVLEQLPPSSQLRGLLEDAVASSRRGAELTRQLLAYAGKGNFASRRLEFSRLISELRSALELSVPASVRLAFSLAEKLREFAGDPVQIHDVVFNMVANAAEATVPPGGTILISTGSEWLDRAQLDGLGAAAAHPGTFVYCEVADGGIGMDEKTLARIFEPFFTTKFLGRGLGLAAVSGIVRERKGAIRISSGLRRGTTIRVLFPALV